MSAVSDSTGPGSAASAGAPVADSGAAVPPAIDSGTAGQPARAHRRWVVPKPAKMTPMMVLLIVTGTLLIIGLALLIGTLAMPRVTNDGPPPLAAEFKDRTNNISIRPPLNWYVDDPHDGWNLYIFGPGEKGFRALMIVSIEISPYKIENYIGEHKARMKKEEKTVKFLSEEDAGAINGYRAFRLEYDCDLDTEGNGKPVKVRTLQFVLDDRPRYYRITCSVAADQYEKYAARFEASAHTFKNIPQAVEQRVSSAGAASSPPGAAHSK